MTILKPMQTIKINELEKGHVYTKSLSLSDREAFLVDTVSEKNLTVISRKTSEKTNIRRTAKPVIFLRVIEPLQNLTK